jgi:hypothetical protein
MASFIRVETVASCAVSTELNKDGRIPTRLEGGRNTWIHRSALRLDVIIFSLDKFVGYDPVSTGTLQIFE